ncbi:MAG: hypothetical protein H7Y08_07955 [Rhizobiaceae bacterium]|nr:hypothetical protein [Rhizobiaceae bacterium]
MLSSIRTSALIVLGFVSTVAGCTTADKFNSVEIARTAMLGFNEQDVRMCAGFPTRSASEGDVTVWSYEGGGRQGGVDISAPVLFGAANANLSIPGGTCRFQVRFQRGRVDRIAYAGDNDSPQGRDTICTPVIDGCVSSSRTFGPSRRIPSASPIEQPSRAAQTDNLRPTPAPGGPAVPN